MAADKTPEQEPSIEEILASIRQIISDDDDKDGANPVPEPVPVKAAPPPAPPKAATPPPPPPPPAPVEEDDVLELIDPLPPEDDFPSIDLQDVMPPPRMESPPMSTNDDILTETARKATVASMAKLAGNMPLTRHRDHGDITLEDLVREMLHPMLKDWLSESLPPMVERMVQRELEKLARKAQDV